MKQLIVTLLCTYTCQISAINLRNLKDVACQITYKVLYDDLREKEKLHRAGHYTMSAECKENYEEQISEFMKACVPADAELDRIERNQAPVEVNWL